MGHCETGLLDSPAYASNASTHVQRTFAQDALLLMYCFLGLQISYLTWGYLQEKIMTQVLVIFHRIDRREISITENNLYFLCYCIVGIISVIIL